MEKAAISIVNFCGVNWGFLVWGRKVVEVDSIRGTDSTIQSTCRWLKVGVILILLPALCLQGSWGWSLPGQGIRARLRHV